MLGSGRTELGLSIFGDKKILVGKIYFNGNEVKINSVYKAINLGIGYVPEDRIKEALFLDKSIGLNIVSARYYDDTLPFGIINNKKLCDIANIWIKELSIKSPSANLSVSSLSGGNQQRVVLAKWLTRNLKLIILNRPTVGIDVASKQYINKMIIDLASKGMSFILISDDLNEFVNLCHKVYLLKDGSISSLLEDDDITYDKNDFIMKKIKFSSQSILSILFILYILYVGIMNPKSFFTLNTLYDILKSSSVYGILALGFLPIIIAGGIDMPFSAVASFSTYVTAILLFKLDLYSSNILIIYLIGIVIGGSIGLLNWYLVALLKVPIIVVTLGTSAMISGLLLFIFGSTVIFNIPPSMLYFLSNYPSLVYFP